MITLADASVQLDETKQILTENAQGLDAQQGIALIDRWVGPLADVEMMQPIAQTLDTLKRQLEPYDSEAIRETVKTLAGQVDELSTQVGSEGEMPSLVDGLAAALRKIADVSRTDTSSVAQTGTDLDNQSVI